MKLVKIFGAAAMLLAMACSQHTPAPQGLTDVGIQLYSVREPIQALLDEGKTIHPILDTLSAMGYTSVEAAGYDGEKFYGLTPEEYKAACEQYGLVPLSSHTGKTLTDEQYLSGDYSEAMAWWDKAIADHKAAGMEYIVYPWSKLPATKAELQTFCNYLNAIGAKCNEEGVKFGYHNHTHEFANVEDVRMLDYIIENTDSDKVFIQMDLIQVVLGQASPVEYFKKYPGRFAMLHVKDRHELGQSGMVGFDAIYDNADLGGVKYNIVEIGTSSYGDILGTAKDCIDYLTTMGQYAPASKPTPKEVGIQLYSVREPLMRHVNNGESIAPMLDSIAAMGYTFVEAAGYGNGKFYGMEPEAFKDSLAAAGLQMLSSHTSRPLSPEELAAGDFTAAMEWWKQCVADHKAAGVEYIVFPWMSVPDTKEKLDNICAYFNQIGALCAENGIKFGYHNHAHEFQNVEDEMMYDYLIANTNPDSVFFQLDVYWSMMGKASAVEYFKKYPGRFKLLHIKDKLEVGQSGMVGFDAIFNAAADAGVENIVVEAEGSSYGDIMRTMAESADYLLRAPFVEITYAK